MAKLSLFDVRQCMIFFGTRMLDYGRFIPTRYLGTLWHVIQGLASIYRSRRHSGRSGRSIRLRLMTARCPWGVINCCMAGMAITSRDLNQPTAATMEGLTLWALMNVSWDPMLVLLPKKVYIRIWDLRIISSGPSADQTIVFDHILLLLVVE